LEGGNTLRYNVGQLVNTGKDNGYSGSSEINAKDPHYNWELGNFFVSGYTRQTDASDGTPIFLKNVGDHVSLWFNLEQDIDMLHGNEALSIAEDVDGYDQYFQTKKTNFGRGTLIIRSTNSENVTDEPKIYTNYLEANTSIGADTKVQLFEEGDYEVALDYKIKNDKTKIFGRSVLPVYTDYRISFKFSIRNGNCMVYPFDIKTGSELTNTSITPNGFYLDLARSKYLDVNVKKEVMNEGADGLTEDVRFNKPAKDGDKYTDEGIYTISVSNRYTEQTTTKKIYVGSNKAMMAYITTGLPFRDINTQIANGATISDDGTIIPPEIGKTTSKVTTEQSATESSVALPYVDSHQRNGIIIALGTVIVVVVVGAFAVVKKKKQKVATENDKEDQDK
jgi:hypothetical protein